MPLYDYECRNCGHIVEVLHGVNASGPAACEQCGGPMRKLMSTPAIVFKGSGWAKKDARDARPKATKSTASGAKNDSTDSKSSDSSSSSSESDSGAGKAAEQTKSGDGAAKQAGTKESSASAAPD